MVKTINPVQKARDRVKKMSQRPNAISKAKNIQGKKDIICFTTYNVICFTT